MIAELHIGSHQIRWLGGSRGSNAGSISSRSRLRQPVPRSGPPQRDRIAADRIQGRHPCGCGRPGGLSRRHQARRPRRSWRAEFGNDQRAAQRELKDAETTGQRERAEQAAADGNISHRHATVIGPRCRICRPTTTPEQREFAETALIRDAQRYSPADLATRARRITDQYKPEPDVDADEDRLLRRREAIARAKTSLQLWDNHDGTWVRPVHGPRTARPDPQDRALMPTPHPAAPTWTRQPTRSSRWTSAKARRSARSSSTSPANKLPDAGGSPIRIVVTISEDEAAVQSRCRHPRHRREVECRRAAAVGRQPRHHPRRPRLGLSPGRPRPHPATVLQGTTRRPRGHGRRLHRPRLRPTTLLVRSPTH